MRVLGTLLSLTLVGCVTVESNPKQEPIANDTERSEARIALGLGYLEQGNMMKAHENLQLALQHSPTYYRAQLSIAHYYEQVGEDEAADKMYLRSIRQNPKNGHVLNNYGAFLCKHGHFEKADKHFNKAIDQPYYYLISASYENAALCAIKAKQTDKAIHYLQRTLDHDPHRSRSILYLAKLEIETKQYQSARLRLMQFHQKYGLQATSLELLAKLEGEVGNRTLQQKYLDKLDEIRA